ncbi:hypothetical protein OG301_33915 [Streptomyces platensis]|uniref:hypothetical protein n=1 Tax=Streptomyces platensis TaxID=58346 RepID=UPI002ED0E1B5|nr:hypothetical protein OG301_33915 [Streptomyces platensis]
MTRRPLLSDTTPSSESELPVETLKELSTALDALGPVVGPALADLGAAEMAMALNALSLRDRQYLLRLLNIHKVAPRRVGRVLSEQVLTRIRRLEDESDQRHAALHLTRRISGEVVEAAFACEHGRAGGDPAARWGATLLRLTVFSHLRASAFDARIVLWVAGQGWFGLPAEPSALTAAADAAARIVDATPHYEWPGAEGESPDDCAHETKAANTGSHAADTAPLAVPAQDTARPRPTGGTTVPEPRQAPPETPTSASGPDVDTACARLEQTVDAARQAGERVHSVLQDGRAPSEDDLALLAAVEPALAHMLALLTAAGHTEVPARLADIIEAVRDHRARAEQIKAARTDLRLLGTFRCHQNSPVADALADAQARAARLLARPVWNADEESATAPLRLLVELVRLRDEPEAAEQLVATQQRLTTVHPPYAVAAVLHDQIESAGPPPVEAATAVTSAAPDEADDSPAPADSDPPAATPSTEPPESWQAGDPADSGAAAGTPDSGSSFGATTARDATAGAAPVPTASATATATATASSEAANARTRPVTDTSQGAPAVTAPAVGPTVPTTPQTDGAPRRQETGAPAHPAPGAADTAAALARLVAEKRFGLAAHLSAAAGRPAAEQAALRLAAVATALRRRSDPAALSLVDALRSEEAQAGTESDGVPLLLLPVLVRTALVTGEPVVGAQLKALVPRLPGALAEVAGAVADPALKGALLIAPPRSVVADVSEAESRLLAAADACRALLTAPTIRFQRATKMVTLWLQPGGQLGAALHAIADGDPEAPRLAEELLGSTGRRSRIEAAIDQMDTELRHNNGRGLQGAGRTNVRQFIARVREAVTEWRAAQHDVGTHHSEGNAWAFETVAALRLLLLGLRERVIADLAAAGHRATPLTAAAAMVAREVLETAFAELADGTSARPVPQDALAHEVAAVLDIELRKLPHPATGPTSVTELLALVDVPWDEAVARQVARDDFTAARTIFDLADRDLLPAAGTLHRAERDRAELDRTEQQRRAALVARVQELSVALGRAQADGALTVEQDVNLQELLADASAPTTAGDAPELAGIRRNLDQVAALLPRYREEAASRLRARLAELPEVSPEDREHVQRALDTDNLATAAELVYFLELGEPVPEVRSQDSHLEAFFPDVPRALPAGITPKLVGTVRNRRRWSGLATLDYEDLSVEQAERAAEALELWHRLASAHDRVNINPRADLTPALSLIGYEAKRARPLSDLPRGKDYRFFELADIQVTGRAWAPAFGSQIADSGHKLRVLLIWDRPSADLLRSRISQDPSENSLLVVHFGTMDQRTRTEFAAGLRDGKPVMVVDDAALAYLAAHGNRRIDAASETMLPFSAVNPYIKEKRGQIGREMFYGRDRERKSILDPQGTQILYGGRGLGKSALLADAGDRFEEQSPSYRKLYLNLDKIGIGRGTAQGADAIWPTLDRELTRGGILEPPRRRGPQPEPYQRVTDGIARWLDADTDRRLLILLDECDRFFESDVPECTETRRLRGLGDASRGRAKVVFAGLHSVQRFTRLARNGPFSHLAQTPTVVGPLAPQFAADLIVHPMRALGFEFDNADLVNRVLGFCSYQPFLLQIFGSRMVQVMQEKRARLALEAHPPYAIEAADVDAVEQDATLRSDITAAFKDTLALDDRYNVVANVLAQHARDHGLETRLSDHQLREECGGWWPQGFEQLDSEGFRAYLQEMVGLGVLAPNHDGRGWHLRGPNALRMIGTAQEIEARLLSAERECRLEEAVVLESRPELYGNRAAPLTVNQIDYVLGEGGNQVRVILGTPATGIADVERTLRDATGRGANWTVPAIGSANVFRRALTDGRAGERRLLVSDLSDGSAKACRESLAQARELVPDAHEATRSVVLISDFEQVDFWYDLLESPEADMAAMVVPLRRHDARSLRDWALARGLFETDQRLHRLAALSGGWPLLLEKVVDLHAGHHDQDRALRELDAWLAEKDGAEEFVEAVGLGEDTDQRTACLAIAHEWNDAWEGDTYVRAAAETSGLAPSRARTVVDCLEVLQVLERDVDRLRVEPVVLAALKVTGALT